MNLYFLFLNSSFFGGSSFSLEISCSLLIFFSLFSFILAWTFISLQIKEFRIMGLSINDSVYSCVFFFLTALHFFHLVVGLLLLSLLFWCCSLNSYYAGDPMKRSHILRQLQDLQQDYEPLDTACPLETSFPARRF